MVFRDCTSAPSQALVTAMTIVSRVVLQAIVTLRVRPLVTPSAAANRMIFISENTNFL